MCGFLNGAGGSVLFGVTNAGRIVGQDVADATFQEIANALRKLEPPAWIVQTRVPVASGRGAGARWWLVTLGTAGRQE